MKKSEIEKIGFISLGCPKNLVDSEVMMGQLKQHGYELTTTREEADVIVVNTCGFIDAAKQESINTILEMAELKDTANCKRLVVAGCLVERYRQDLLNQLPEVDAVLGTSEIEKIVAAVDPAAVAKAVPDPGGSAQHSTFLQLASRPSQQPLCKKIPIGAMVAPDNRTQDPPDHPFRPRRQFNRLHRSIRHNVPAHYSIS